VNETLKLTLESIGGLILLLGIFLAARMATWLITSSLKLIALGIFAVICLGVIIAWPVLIIWALFTAPLWLWILWLSGFFGSGSTAAKPKSSLALSHEEYSRGQISGEELQRRVEYAFNPKLAAKSAPVAADLVFVTHDIVVPRGAWYDGTRWVTDRPPPEPVPPITLEHIGRMREKGSTSIPLGYRAPYLEEPGYSEYHALFQTSQEHLEGLKYRDAVFQTLCPRRPFENYWHWFNRCSNKGLYDPCRKTQLSGLAEEWYATLLRTGFDSQGRPVNRKG
jgi:hypothetical protein